MLVKLGKELSKCRKSKGLSLDAVASPSKISGAYLHKLERGLVNDPSPRVLARIAGSLDISYVRLMTLAGYLDETQLVDLQRRESPNPHPLVEQQLTHEEWKAVGAFIKKLIDARQPKSGKTQ